MSDSSPRVINMRLLYVPVPLDPALIRPAERTRSLRTPAPRFTLPENIVGNTGLASIVLSRGGEQGTSGTEAFPQNSWFVAEIRRFVDICETQHSAMLQLEADGRLGNAVSALNLVLETQWAHNYAREALELAVATDPDPIQKIEINLSGRKDAVIRELTRSATVLAVTSKKIHESFPENDGPVADITSAIGPPSSDPAVARQQQQELADNYLILRALCPQGITRVGGDYLIDGEAELALMLLTARAAEEFDARARAAGLPTGIMRSPVILPPDRTQLHPLIRWRQAEESLTVAQVEQRIAEHENKGQNAAAARWRWVLDAHHLATATPQQFEAARRRGEITIAQAQLDDATAAADPVEITFAEASLQHAHTPDWPTFRAAEAAYYRAKARSVIQKWTTPQDNLGQGSAAAREHERRLQALTADATSRGIPNPREWAVNYLRQSEQSQPRTSSPLDTDSDWLVGLQNDRADRSAAETALGGMPSAGGAALKPAETPVARRNTGGAAKGHTAEVQQ
ncbi:hypothetical protein ABZX12_03855 [Kribbella sp. NPDC003505]|uniref:hypothetical protein n=1 Tax=Kribbella sp. NPDC003505 TaxID=3154448 RepID=UPI0033AEEC93